MTDWSKVFEVFSSGIIGVFLVMFLLQILTQLSTRVIDFVENGKNGGAPEAVPVPKSSADPAKD
ncbi:MAG TPA: hypothetical protein VIR78_06565 [Malonomonas sp.]